MKKKSLLTMVLALTLVGAVGIGATLAYLSSTTTTLTNTFSVGDVDITQDESDESTPDNPDDRTDKGNNYDDIQPGDELKKDPTVTVKANSSDCYVFMQLTGADALVAKSFTFNGFSDAWVKVSGDANTLDGVYQYKDVVTKNAADQTLAPLFTSVTYSLDATEVNDADLGAVTIKSCAVQEANMTAAEALAAANTEMAK